MSLSFCLCAAQLLSADSLGYANASSPLSPSAFDDSDLATAQGVDADGLPVKSSPSKHPRLMSLDCFRGLTIAWMIMASVHWHANTRQSCYLRPRGHERPTSMGCTLSGS